MSRGWLIFMWAVIGGVVGQLIGSALASSGQIAFMDKSIPLGFSPTDLNLSFVVLTLGIQLKLSIAGAVGLVVALWLALRNA